MTMRFAAPDDVPKSAGGQASGTGTAAGKLARLRESMAAAGIDGFVIPRSDAHQGEFVAPRDERLAWLTGFTGSAGTAIVLAEKAAVFVDGRYTLQVTTEVDGSLYAFRHITNEPADAWLADHLGEGAVLGIDPWLHSVDQAKRIAAACSRAGASLVLLDNNPLDAVWDGQPGPPTAPVMVHDETLAGESSSAKRGRIAGDMAAKGEDCVFLSLPDSINWLLNIRGGDIPHTPVALGFALLHRDGAVDFFIDPGKIDAAVRAHLGDEVRIAAPGALGGALDDLGTQAAAVRLETASAPEWVRARLETAGADIRPGADPCQLPKACKNPVELDGIRTAHVRDGASLTKFLAWLAGAAAAGDVTELSASDRLQAFREERDELRDLSFATIAGAGPNGAIVHYRVTPATDRALEPGTLFLVDSGGQYADGTTDVTRTVAIGTPDAEMRDRFTRVLKGHIALARARFPEGTTGSQLDVLARAPLWEAGLDYDHGTGHGVGAYLGVHEGPQRISKIASAVALKPGMVISNEPGFYKSGAYGIRIENLVAVRQADREDGTGADGPGMLEFETLTLAPIDRALIEPSMLSAGERAWLDAYHAGVGEKISPLVDDATRSWLEQATAPIAP